jgi:phytoene desaturase
MTTAKDKRRVVVIGSGLGGLSAACTLAARGHAVTLLERNAWLGGKAAVLESNGFRFDMGPTILTLPSVLRRVFGEAGRDMDAELPLIHLDPQWRCFFADGSRLDLTRNVSAMAAALDQYAPGTDSGPSYRRFIELSRRLHDISDRYFFWKPIGGMRDMFQVRDSTRASTLSDVRALGMGHSVASTIRSHTPDGRVAQMLDHFTQYVGSDPGRAPAVLAGIAHMQCDEGIWYPRGGTAAVPRALAKLAADLGAELRTGAQVRRIITADGAVTGVELESGQTLACDAVVSNMDSVRTHCQLLGGKIARRFARQRSYEPACSGVVLYLGLSRRYDHLLHHNFVFSRDPHEEFEAIYDKGIPAPDPTCYVCAPACTEPQVAPPGGEAMYVLVHGPYLRDGQDWQKMLPAYREVILNKLARTAGLTDLRSRIVFESALTPGDIDERYQVLQGAIYGLASHGKFVGAFKPGNRSRLVKGLYLAGGAAHPGPGMPMVLMSGWIAADALDKDSQGALV